MNSSILDQIISKNSLMWLGPKDIGKKNKILLQVL